MDRTSKLRRTNSYFITLAAGAFKTTAEAIHIANNLIRSMRKWSECKKYAIEVVVYICDEKPIEKCSDDSCVDPHIHIILLANPGNTVSKEIVRYLNDKAEASNCVNCQKIYDPENLIKYLQQYKYFRTLAVDPLGLKDFKASHVTSRNKLRLIIEDIKNLIYGEPVENEKINKNKIADDFWTFNFITNLKNTDNSCILWFLKQ